jgi:hypothetical protein
VAEAEELCGVKVSRLYKDSIKALSRLYQGSIKALIRAY